MEVIIKLSECGYSAEVVAAVDGPATEDIRRDIFKYIKEEYNDSANDQEVYLYETADEADNFLFGLTESKKLLDRVAIWNDEIRNALISAMESILDDAQAAVPMGPLAAGISLNTNKTYALSCAAREADNHWFDFADHAVLCPNSYGYAYFQTIISDELLEDIKANPQEYVIVTVYPK